MEPILLGGLISLGKEILLKPLQKFQESRNFAQMLDGTEKSQHSSELKAQEVLSLQVKLSEAVKEMKAHPAIAKARENDNTPLRLDIENDNYVVYENDKEILRFSKDSELGQMADKIRSLSTLNQSISSCIIKHQSTSQDNCDNTNTVAWLT